MNASAVMCIDAWQIRHYAQLSQPVTARAAAEELDFFLDHRDALRSAADEQALPGVARSILYSLVGVACVDAVTPRKLRKKVKTLAEHRTSWVDHPFYAGMIEAAVRSDVAALGLDAAEKTAVLQLLRGTP